MPPLGDLTTLTNVRRTLLQQNITSSNDDDDDDLLKRYITQASALVHRRTQRSFLPYVDSRLQDFYSAYHLDLDADLLALTALTNGDGSSIDLANVRYQPANDTPKWRLSITRGATFTFTFQDDPEGAIEVEGVWGYHSDYANAWIDTLADVPSGGLSSSATTMTTPDASGLDAQGQPRFEVGGLYRINDEFIKVVDITFQTDPTPDDLTIRRAQLGSTATIHAENDDIERWQVLPDVEWLVVRLVTWGYQHRDVVNSLEFLDTNVVLRDESLRDIFAGLDTYRPRRIGAL